MARVRTTIMALAILPLIGAIAGASEIGSASVKKKSFDVHESMTRLAIGCVQRTDARPVNCVDLFEMLVPLTRQAITTRPDELAHAARWPDDPTRRLDSDLSKPTFGVLLKFRCEDVVAKKPDLNTAGLECSSHFGRLQFLHAQANSDDIKAHSGSTLRDATRAKILAWARFSFLAATDQSFLGQNLCGIDPQYRIDAALMHAFRTSTRDFCAGTRKYAPWTVQTLYELQCKKLSAFSSCKRLGPAAARLAATGALLHLVQDSFSQSHVARLADRQPLSRPTGPFEAKSVCAPITAFYEYGEQNADKKLGDPHGKADRPSTLDSTCRNPDRLVDDVITATATVLWHIIRAQEGKRCDATRSCDDALIEYLSVRVFRLA